MNRTNSVVLILMPCVLNVSDSVCWFRVAIDLGIKKIPVLEAQTVETEPATPSG